MAQHHDRSLRYTGTRSQFRISCLSPFKSTCPIHFTEIMDAGKSSVQDVSQKDLDSPVRGTTRTVREYEDTIDKFSKENLDLKMRLYLLECNMDKNLPKCSVPQENNTVEVVLNLKNETESLRDELEKCILENKELQTRLTQQEQELTLFYKLPSEEEFMLLQDEMNSLRNENETLVSLLTERDEKIEKIQHQLEELSAKNKTLEAKNKKSSLAIQGIVSKYHNDIIEIPTEFRADIQDAIKAAKQNDEEKMVNAIQSFMTALRQIMFTSESYQENKENSKDFNESFSAHESCKIASPMPTSNVHVQTEVQWKLLQESSSNKLLQSAGHSDNVEELREEILMLLLVIEEKEKEILKSEKTLVSLQEKVNCGYNQNISSYMDADLVVERNDLHDRLARSCAINNELMKQLKSLGKFLAELLQHNSINSSSFEDLSEQSFFLSQLTKSLNESLKLGQVLSSNLSVCENSKIFDVEDLVYKDISQLSNISYLPSEKSHLDMDMCNIDQSIQTGRAYFKSSSAETSSVISSKRRLFPTQTKTSSSASSLNPNNCVVMETSNNEDVILLLNDQGNPEDVLIRNHKDNLLPSNGNNCKSVPNPGNFKLHRSNGVLQKHYWSSDSDIWSEPDRNISLQRIGIDVQLSPTSQKSPRKSRHSRRSTDERSTEKTESTSSGVRHQMSRRRRSGDLSKSSIYKKCKSSEESLKEKSLKEYDVDELISENEKQKQEIEDIKESIRENSHLIESMRAEKEQLLNNIKELKSNLATLIEEKSIIANENSQTQERLVQMNKNTDILEDIVKKLKLELSDSDSMCHQLKTELDEMRKKLEKLDEAYSRSEEKLQLNSQLESNFSEKVKTSEAVRKKLEDRLSEITLSQKSILEQLNTESKSKCILEEENSILNCRIKEKLDEIASLRLSNQQLCEERGTLMKENETSKESLFASTKLTEKLQHDLKELHRTLEAMKHKCSSYEEKLSQSSKSDQNLVESLSQVKSQLLSNLSAMQAVATLRPGTKHNINHKELVPHSVSESNIDRSVESICKSIVVENVKFKELVDRLTQDVHEMMYRLHQLSSSETESKTNIESMLKQLQLKEEELSHLREQNKNFQVHVAELENSIEENKEREIWASQQQLNLKHQLEDEITTLRSACKDKEKQLEQCNTKLVTLQARISALKNKISKYELQISSENDRKTNQSLNVRSERTSALFSEEGKSSNKFDASDRESAMSEETIALSRSFSPVSFEGNFSPKSNISFPKDFTNKESLEDVSKSIHNLTHKVPNVSGSQDSLFQRSQYSSPDLGIESDPNHESSAPEQAEREHIRNRGLKRPDSQKDSFCNKDLHRHADDFKENKSNAGGVYTIHAVGVLKEYLLLKKEVQEALVAIRSVLSRTGDGLKHIVRHSSPRKNLEYDTFKAIKDTCVHIEVCLNKAYKMVNGFWTSPFISEVELKKLLQQNLELQDNLKRIYKGKKQQEQEFKDAMERLKHSEKLKENMDKKIYKKLIKTNKVIHKMEEELTVKNAKDQISRYPFDQPLS